MAAPYQLDSDWTQVVTQTKGSYIASVRMQHISKSIDGNYTNVQYQMRIHILGGPTPSGAHGVAKFKVTIGSIGLEQTSSFDFRSGQDIVVVSGIIKIGADPDGTIQPRAVGLDSPKVDTLPAFSDAERFLTVPVPVGPRLRVGGHWIFTYPYVKVDDHWVRAYQFYRIPQIEDPDGGPLHTIVKGHWTRVRG